MVNVLKDLLFLTQKYPKLPVIPVVYGEVTGSCTGYWEGSWESVRLDEYLIMPDEWEPLRFKSRSDVLETLNEFLPPEEYEKVTLEDCQRYYDALPWHKAIIVQIGMPPNREIDI